MPVKARDSSQYPDRCVQVEQAVVLQRGKRTKDISFCTLITHEFTR